MTCDDLACKLAVEPLPGGAASIEPLTDDGTVRVDALGIPELTARLCRACGIEPFVLIGRPDLGGARDQDGWVAFRGLRVRRAPDGGVSFAIGGNTETLPEATARQCAAVTVALADEEELDSAEVEDLAHAIRLGLYPDGDRIGLRPGESDRKSARAALRWMREREAGRD